MITFISTPNCIDFLMPTHSFKGCSGDNLRLVYLRANKNQYGSLDMAIKKQQDLMAF